MVLIELFKEMPFLLNNFCFFSLIKAVLFD
nr:MAG TPA: hypothetical protein [Caudoviricetes sp.]DAT06421.1 MAG TPA: hypothetical protein [Caudoviricetes sp.]